MRSYAYRKRRAKQLPTFSSRRLVAAVLFAATLLGTATAALAQPAATGSSSAIAIDTKVTRAFLHVRVQSYVQHGLVWMSAVDGKTPSFHWALSGPQRGFYPATEHGLVALTSGRVSWSRDDLTPAPCTPPGICSREPVQVVADSSGLFYAFGNASKHTCYRPLSASPTEPWKPVGTPLWFVDGHYQAPVASGSTETITITYPWSSTQTATEVDTIAKGSYRPLASVTTVSAGAQAAAFSVSTSFGYPSSVPPPPQVTLCG